MFLLANRLISAHRVWDRFDWVTLPSREYRFSQIVEQLRSLIGETVFSEEEKHKSLSTAAVALNTEDVTELIIGARQLRNKRLGIGFFGEPAWDILLNLHLAHYRQQAVSVTAAVTFGDTPPTTGLRWLKALEHGGLIERQGDPNDNRRSFITLSEEGLTRLDSYVADYSAWIATKATLKKI